MRVIAGICRSLPLETLPGKDTRPTTDRIKETLFNILQPYIPGCRFLDLFAGSGAIGIEALSRGAESCCFVEKSRKASDVIRRNLEFTGLSGKADVLTSDVLAAIHFPEFRGGDPFDVVFMDPPYNNELERRALELLSGSRCVTGDTLFVAEASLDTDFGWADSAGYSCVRVKKYKTNQHVFLKEKSL